jgi:protein SCO1/2
MFAFSIRRQLGLWALVVALAAVALTACGDKKRPVFQGGDITGTQLGKGLALTDFNGKPHTIKDFAGKVVVVFFGFTQCPDICPTSLVKLAETMNLLGTDANHVQVLMVTVDPERDTPDILKQYVTAFNPRFLGLTGTPEEIRQVAASFKAYYAKVSETDGTYTIDHTASFYLFDKKGESRVLASNDMTAAALAQDIKTLLN